MVYRLLSIAALLVVVAVPVAMNYSDVSAAGFTYGSGYNYPHDVPVYNQRFGGGSVQGYVSNPYASGSFEAPDLLNDPLFQAEHKFDSHFMGRYSPNDMKKYYHPDPAPRRSGGFFHGLLGW